jgi:hypothetical protein
MSIGKRRRIIELGLLGVPPTHLAGRLRTFSGHTCSHQFSMKTLASVLASLLLVSSASPKPSDVIVGADGILRADNVPVFPIGFTMPPPPDGRTPEGKNGIAELAAAGATFLRTGGDWDKQGLAQHERYLDAAARYGMYCLPYLRENAFIDSPQREKQLRDILKRFKDHPGLGAWKGDDEPAWGERPLPPLLKAYQVIKEVDPHHPVVIIHAPRGTVGQLRAYNSVGDILGADIYPVSYPPGVHSELTNKSISLVGDHTRIMMEVAQDKMPVWMVLQISWSGVLKPGKTLRFPTFPEERFMTYQAIINGARGLLYFGGNNEGGMSPRDKKLGWNWTFWQRVLRPVIEEIGTKSPLYPALVAPNSNLPIKVSPSEGLEFVTREVGNDLFVLSCKSEGATAKVQFSGLPADLREGEVMFESPRRIEAKDGKFSDWFGPFEVHVYRFNREIKPGARSSRD